MPPLTYAEASGFVAAAVQMLTIDNFHATVQLTYLSQVGMASVLGTASADMFRYGVFRPAFARGRTIPSPHSRHRRGLKSLMGTSNSHETAWD